MSKEELMGHRKVLLKKKKVDIGNEVHDSKTTKFALNTPD